jgi:hypothetical protein
MMLISLGSCLYREILAILWFEKGAENSMAYSDLSLGFGILFPISFTLGISGNTFQVQTQTVISSRKNCQQQIKETWLPVQSFSLHPQTNHHTAFKLRKCHEKYKQANWESPKFCWLYFSSLLLRLSKLNQFLFKVCSNAYPWEDLKWKPSQSDRQHISA